MRTARVILLTLVLLMMIGTASATESYVSYWDFNEGSGNSVYDKTGFNNASISGSNVSWIGGKSGNGLYFTGLDTDAGHINFGTVHKYTGDTGFTVSFWYMDDEGDNVGSTYDVLVTKEDAVVGGYGYTLYRKNSNVYWKVGTTEITKTTTFNEWNHFAGTYGKYNDTHYVSILFINGVETERKYFTTPIAWASPERNFAIARSGHPSYTAYARGTFDELKVYDKSFFNESDIVLIMATEQENNLIMNGIQANLTGDTIITENTVWSNGSINLGGNIVLTNTSNGVTFTISNCNLTFPNGKKMIMGGDTLSNVLIESSTILFNVTTGTSTASTGLPRASASYGGYDAVINGDSGIKVDYSASKLSTLEIYNSTITTPSKEYRARGVWVNSVTGQKHILKMNNVDLSNLGALAGGTGYYAVNIGTPNAATDVHDIMMTNCWYGISLGAGVPVYNITTVSGGVLFIGGSEWYNVNMGAAYEGLYQPANNGLVYNSYFNGGGTKLNLMTSSNVEFRNNIVESSAFNVGDSSTPGQGENNYVHNNTFYNTTVNSRHNGTRYEYNIHSSGMPSAGAIGHRLWGSHQTAIGNVMTNMSTSTALYCSPYPGYPTQRGNIISDNVITGASRGVLINDQLDAIVENNTVTASSMSFDIMDSSNLTFSQNRVSNLVNITSSQVSISELKDINYNMSLSTEINGNNIITVDSTADNSSVMTWVGSLNVDISSTIPTFANRNVSLYHDSVYVGSANANDTGYVSISYSGLNGTFEFVDSGELFLEISEFSPYDTTPTIQSGQSQQFSATTNGEGTFVWTRNGATVRTTPGVTTDSYTASGLAASTYNITVTVTSGEDVVSHSWTLTVEGFDFISYFPVSLTPSVFENQSQTFSITTAPANHYWYNGNELIKVDYDVGYSEYVVTGLSRGTYNIRVYAEEI